MTNWNICIKQSTTMHYWINKPWRCLLLSSFEEIIHSQKYNNKWWSFLFSFESDKELYNTKFRLSIPLPYIMLHCISYILEGGLLDFLITWIFGYNFPTLPIPISFGFFGAIINHYIILLPTMVLLRKERNSKYLWVKGFPPKIWSRWWPTTGEPSHWLRTYDEGSRELVDWEEDEILLPSLTLLETWINVEL
jgi:hypothetical protein